MGHPVGLISALHRMCSVRPVVTLFDATPERMI